MSNTGTRTLLERACAKAVDTMLTGDDVATVRQATGHHVVIIRTVASDEREARTIQRREEHAENARADTERELSRIVDELAHVRETGAAELTAASDALASAAAEVDALRAELARQTGIAVDHCARAEKAEELLAQWMGVPSVPSTTIDTALIDGLRAERDEAVEERDAAIVRAEKAEALVASTKAIDEVLAKTIAGGGPWCRAAERDAAIAARDEAVAAFERSGAKGLVAMAQRDAAERARDEVGIQLAAAQARIKLLEEGAALLRDLYEDRGEPKWGANGANHYHVQCDVIDIGVGCFLSALDAVPGDALAPVVPPSPAGASAQPSGSTPAASSATSSSSEAAASPSAPRGTCDASVRALIDAARAVDRCYDTGSSIRSSMYRLREALDGLRITAALEASGIDSSNVKEKA